MQLNNTVTLVGKIASRTQYDHEVRGERFYKLFLDVERTSGEIDKLPLLVSERIFDASQDYESEYVVVKGAYRSFNRSENQKRHLVLYVFVEEMVFVEIDLPDIPNNEIYLKGVLCKDPIHRKTSGGTKISDVLLQVLRETTGKKDYIPCVLWDRNAEYARRSLSKGMRVELWGRIQRRLYPKKTETGIQYRIAYEVSVSNINMV